MDNRFFSNYNLLRMEMYRSGHNGAHSKCVSPPGHEGSNPSISVFMKQHRQPRPCCFYLCNRKLLEQYLQEVQAAGPELFYFYTNVLQ